MCGSHQCPPGGCGGQARGGVPSGSVMGASYTSNVDGTPRFVQQQTHAAPIAMAVDGGYLVPGELPGAGQAMYLAGDHALYEDLYGAMDANGKYVAVRYPGSWGRVVAFGKGR